MGKARGLRSMNGVWHSPRSCFMLLTHFMHLYLGLECSGSLKSLLGFKFSPNPQRTVSRASQKWVQAIYLMKQK